MRRCLNRVNDMTQSNSELLALIEQLQADLSAAKAAKANALTLKVSKKGGVSMYGLGRYPVTQYKQGWARIIELIKSGELEAFIERNMALLSTGKDDPRFADIGDE